MAQSDSTASTDAATARRALYRAACRNDTRSDGRLFIAVRTTGIYCRPVCRVKMPKFENCTFYTHAAQAEQAGFRPCLLCRPELAPGDPHVDAESTLARLALRRIEDGALNGNDLDALAREFGVCARRLHGEMITEFGVSPIEFAGTQRLLHAKKLLTETTMSTADVAFAAGFDNARHFVALFNSRYRLAPGAFRRRLTAPECAPEAYGAAEPLAFRIDYRPPLNWATLLAFLGARAIPGVEAVVGDAYVRTVGIGQHRGWIAISPYPQTSGRRPHHALRLTLSKSLTPVCIEVITKVKTVFDVRADPITIEAQLSQDPLLARAIVRDSGMRLPGAFDGFELLLRAILGQQVSVKGATTLAGRMARAFGEPISTPWPALTHLSPDVGRIAEASVDDIAPIGMPGKRAATIREVARAVREGELTLAPGADPEVVRAALIAVPGIGEWTASYVAMRALAWPDAMPDGDLGIRKALDLKSSKAILERTEAWRPWRAYGAIYLWLGLSGG